MCKTPFTILKRLDCLNKKRKKLNKSGLGSRQFCHRTDCLGHGLQLPGFGPLGDIWQGLETLWMDIFVGGCRT